MDEMVAEFDDFLPNRLNPINESISRRRGRSSPSKARDAGQFTHKDVPRINIVNPSDSHRSQRKQEISTIRKEEEENSFESVPIKITNLSEVLKNRPFENLSVIREQQSNSNSKSVSMRKLEFSAERQQKSSPTKKRLAAEFASQPVSQVNKIGGNYYCGEVETDLDSVFENFFSNQSNKQNATNRTIYTTYTQVSQANQEDARSGAKRLRTSDNEVIFRTAESKIYLVGILILTSFH